MQMVEVWKCVPGRGDPLNVTDEWHGKSVNEITSALPGGVYTTLRTYGRVRTLRLESHFARLVGSAKILGRQIDIDSFWLREKMRVAINLSSFSEIRMRIQIPLNTSTLAAYLMLGQLTLPGDADYLTGVEVTTRLMQREHADAKYSEFVSSAEKIRHSQSAQINEVIMTGEDGTYLEGLSSNFFMIEKGRVLTAQKGVLAGITREIVMDILTDQQIPVILEGFPVARTADAEECFITSTSRGVLPVVKIDQKLVGCGHPGPLTKRIRTLFDEKIDQLIEEI